MAFCLILTLGALPGVAQREAPSQGISTSPAPATSPLDGNWQITGNRERKQYPLLSMAIHVDGSHVTAVGDEYVVCPTTPQLGGGGTMDLAGEIGPDGSFTLRTTRPRNTIQASITGKVPDAGATNWVGTYSFTGRTSPLCTLDQEGTFTASPLAQLVGSFAGTVTMSYASSPPPPGYSGPRTANLKFSISATQGEFLTHQRKVGSAFAYLPLTGTIDVAGSSCFKHGISYESPYATVEGDRAHLDFMMNDESELSFIAVYTSREERGLVIEMASVKGGKCDKQVFSGTLQRK